MSDILPGMVNASIFSAIGLVLLLLGFVLVDILTPGALRQQIWVDRNRNAAVYLSSSLIGTGGIVFTSIMTTYSDLAVGIVSTVAFGLLGLALKAAAFWIVDVLTPGRLGEMLVDTQSHPAVRVSSAANLAISAVVCASIA